MDLQSAFLPRRTFVRRIAALAAAGVVASCGVASLNPPRVRHIGFLGQNPQGPGIESLRQALRDRGLTEGRDFVFEARYADGFPERLPELAAELVDLRVDVILTIGGLQPTRAAKQATSMIPIVFTNVEDPVENGLVASLARPGGNVTGMTGRELRPKRLEVLKETVPGLASVVVLGSARNPEEFATSVRLAQDTARTLGVDTVQPIALDGPDDIGRALELVRRQRPDALVQENNFAFFVGRSANLAKLLDFAIEQRLPQIHRDPEFARAGGLMALRPNDGARWRICARLIDKILSGAGPADLPVELNDVYDFALNLSTAEKIGLTFPASVRGRATEFIR